MTTGRFTVGRAALRDALGVLAAVAPRKSNIPALGTLRVEANGDVRIAATDLEYGAVVRLRRLDGGTGGALAAVPAHALAQHVRRAKGETVAFEDAGHLTTRIDGAASLVGFDPAEWPAVPDVEGAETLAAFDAAELAEALPQVRYAVSSEVVRYALTGVLLEARGRKAAVVASDGKRLAARTVARLDRGRREVRAIVPVFALEAAARLARFAEPGARVEYAPLGEINAVLRVGKDAAVFTRLIDGNFPDWEAVFPSNVGEGFGFDGRALREAVETVLPATSDKTRAVRLRFKGGRLEVYARTPDVGDARAEIAADGAGEAEAAFNPYYILDWLSGWPKGQEAGRVRLGPEPGSASLWEGPPSLRYVLMPLTVNV